jgi:hypothetical protein
VIVFTIGSFLNVGHIFGKLFSTIKVMNYGKKWFELHFWRIFGSSSGRHEWVE